MESHGDPPDPLHFLGLPISCQVTSVGQRDHDIAAQKLPEATY